MIRRLSLLLFALPAFAAAPPARPLISLGSAGDGPVAAPLQIVILLTALTMLPAVIMSITPFLRISVVLHFLRQALGTQTVPSNQTLIGMSLFLALLVVQPMATDIYHQSWEPFEAGKIGASAAAESAAKPVHDFLIRFAREKDIALFLRITGSPRPATPADVELKVLIPAYIISELKSGFQIGVVLYLPFLIIDIVVASVTLSIGMVQLPPVMVSAPFKVLLFVLVDGWNLVIGSLMKGFYP